MAKSQRKKRFRTRDKEYVEVRNPWLKSIRHSETYLKALPLKRRPLTEEQKERRKSEMEMRKYIRDKIRNSNEVLERKNINLAVRRVIDGPSIKKLVEDLDVHRITEPEAKELLDKIIAEAIDFVSFPRK